MKKLPGTYVMDAVQASVMPMLNVQLAALSFGVYRAAFDIHLFAYAVRATVHRAADAAHAGGLLP